MAKLSRPDVILDDEAIVGVVVDDVTTIKGMERPDVYLSKKAHKVILVNPDGTPFVGGGGTGGSISWENIENKPTTFPPSAHNHNISQIDDLQDELDSLKSRISELELEVDLLKNGTDDKALQYLVKEHIITNVIDEPRKGLSETVEYPKVEIGENVNVLLKEV